LTVLFASIRQREKTNGQSDTKETTFAAHDVNLKWNERIGLPQCTRAL